MQVTKITRIPINKICRPCSRFYCTELKYCTKCMGKLRLYSRDMRWDTKDYEFIDHSREYFNNLPIKGCLSCSVEIKSLGDKDLCFKCYFGRTPFSRKGIESFIQHNYTSTYDSEQE